jgi:hypothetical protein
VVPRRDNLAAGSEAETIEIVESVHERGGCFGDDHLPTIDREDPDRIATFAGFADLNIPVGRIDDGFGRQTIPEQGRPAPGQGTAGAFGLERLGAGIERGRRLEPGRLHRDPLGRQEFRVVRFRNLGIHDTLPAASATAIDSGDSPNRLASRNPRDHAAAIAWTSGTWASSP